MARNSPKKRSVLISIDKSAPQKEVYVLTCRQDELNWRRIVFLPFNFYWKIAIAVTGCLYFSMIMFQEIFAMGSQDFIMYFNNILIAITVFYLIDFILALLHCVWLSVQKSKPYPTRPFCMFLIDFVSLLPTRFITKEQFINEDGIIIWTNLVNLNGCLRIYKVFYELMNLQERMGISAVSISIIQQNALLLCKTSVLSSIWFILGFIHKETGNSWLNQIAQSIDMDEHNSISLYFTSIIQVFGMLNNEVIVYIKTTVNAEIIFWFFILFIGYLLRMGFMLANMMSAFLKCYGHMYKIQDHIKINIKCLKGKYYKEIEGYYNSFWNNWLGLYTCPRLKHFPYCLQKDILTDVYWDAINHSHILRYFKDSIKRQISLVMESRFMQPGDHIFRKGEIRSTYYYIASGVVQIMSHYDGISPIMTISSGSCLGGMSLILPSSSPTDVICATVCEVRVLTYKNFHKTLCNFPDGKGKLLKIGKLNVGKCKMMYVLSRNYRIDDPIMKMYGVPQHDKLRWIKQRWRSINQVEKEIDEMIDKNYRKGSEDHVNIEMTHTSKYLDIIVLSSEVKWDADKCCLHSTCPYVLDPNCNFIKVWLAFIVTMITMDCLITPYCAAFGITSSEFLDRWDNTICFAYIFDIYLQAITAVKSVDQTITEPMRLLRHHLKSLMFVIDIIGTIPVREICRFVYLVDRIPRYAALPRLLKIVRVYEYFQYKYNLITTSAVITQLLKITYIYVFIIYFAACFAFMLACRFDIDNNKELVCIKNSWYQRMNPESGTTTYFLYYLLDSLSFVQRPALNCGLKHIPSKIPQDIIFISILVFVANNAVVIIYSELIAMWIMKRKRKVECKELTVCLTTVLTQKHIHTGLSKMLTTYIELQWKANYAVEINLNSTLASELPCPVLRAERKNIVTEYMKSVPFFEQLADDTFIKVRSCFRLYTIPRDFIFCRAGDQPNSFNIIIKGFCNLTSMLKEDLITYPDGKIIGPGSNFPLFEIFHNFPCLQTTISVSTCEVAAIDVITLKTILNKDAAVQAIIKSAVQTHLNELDIVLSKAKYRKEPRRDPSFHIHHIKRAKATFFRKLILNWVRNNRNMRKRLISFWSNVVIIHPHGRFMFIWETLKLIQVLMTMFYIPAMFLLWCNDALSLMVIIILDIFSMADIIVRSYLGYHNRVGIVIRKNWYYLSHSLSVDLISSFPVYLLLEGYNFHVRFYFTMFVKMLQIYRIYGYFRAFHKAYNIDNFFVMFSNFFIHLLVGIYLISVCLLATTCTVQCPRYEMSCTVEGTWLETFKKVPDTSGYLLFTYFHAILTVCMAHDQAHYYIINGDEILAVLIISIVSCVFKCYFLPRATSYLIGGHNNFTKHRDHLLQFWLFINNEGGDKRIADKIQNHFKYYFQRSKGINMNSLVSTLHPSLRSDLTFAMYRKGMYVLQYFVDESKIFMKLITGHLGEIFYLKDSVVLNYNEINHDIFFVLEGGVHIHDAEGIFVRTIGQGSMFGSFTVEGDTRHKYKFTTKYNAALLMINSQDFLKVLGEYSKESTNRFFELTKDKEFVEYISGSSSHGLEPLYESKAKGALNKDSKTFRWLMFVLSMVVPYITIYPLFFCMVSIGEMHLACTCIIYIMDVISLLRIYLGFNVTYTDEVTGEYISDLRRIRIRYITNVTEFGLDVITVLPIELVAFAFDQNAIDVLRFNRLGRIFIIIKYALSHAERTYIKFWLRWLEFGYIVTLVPFMFSCIWIHIVCPNGCTMGDERTEKYSLQSFSYAFQEVITLFTFTPSYHLDKPTTKEECILMTVFTLISFAILPLTIASFAQTLDMTNFSKKSYEYDIQCMKFYLQLRDLSASLLESLWNYSFLLWSTNKGRYFPFYVETAPKNMKCELLFDLYGAHLRYNVLFDECNLDFVIQLSGRIQRTVYFPGDFIIRKFDYDGKMYFVNAGEVESVEFDENNIEIVQEVYITGQCFGLAQGLYERLCHMTTYKARNTVEILTLERSSWADLRNVFSEDAVRIFYHARRLSLDVRTH